MAPIFSRPGDVVGRLTCVNTYTCIFCLRTMFQKMRVLIVAAAPPSFEHMFDSIQPSCLPNGQGRRTAQSDLCDQCNSRNKICGGPSPFLRGDFDDLVRLWALGESFFRRASIHHVEMGQYCVGNADVDDDDVAEIDPARHPLFDLPLVLAVYQAMYKLLNGFIRANTQSSKQRGTVGAKKNRDQERIDRELVAARQEAQELANSLVSPDDRVALRQEWMSLRLPRLHDTDDGSRIWALARRQSVDVVMTRWLIWQRDNARRIGAFSRAWARRVDIPRGRRHAAIEEFGSHILEYYVEEARSLFESIPLVLRWELQDEGVVWDLRVDADSDSDDSMSDSQLTDSSESSFAGLSDDGGAANNDDSDDDDGDDAGNDDDNDDLDAGDGEVDDLLLPGDVDAEGNIVRPGWEVN
ncbi:hypothetical protein MAPG_10572 [Magnaporthiopsis poae ATCC 64411]|uniref:Uncharacterized protein n=1 Tax=Magnaporthiopsis poae (strain ATCC 64411 / 73-15) TaxID=644358 RepID=A0A0C4ECY3_MAGP6|nr:hypothetical protein MAPG_10572 [Magnaporthiopsis poae ATCC 64411]